MSGHFIGGTVFYSSPTAPARHQAHQAHQAHEVKFKPMFFVEVEQGRCLQGWVTHIDNPFHYYVQFIDRKTIKYLEMVTELNSQAASASVAESPQIGMLFIKFHLHN